MQANPLALRRITRRSTARACAPSSESKYPAHGMFSNPFWKMLCAALREGHSDWTLPRKALAGVNRRRSKHAGPMHLSTQAQEWKCDKLLDHLGVEFDVFGREVVS